MEQKIWWKLLQILLYRNDLIEKNKSFMEKLYNKSNNQIYDLNDEKYVSFLKTFPNYHLKLLHNNGIIDDKNIYFLFKIKKNYQIHLIMKKKE